jgi:hypothetical protein
MSHAMIAWMLVSYSMPCMARDLSVPAARISGAKVETESAAKRLAFDHYLKKMKCNISATEAVREVVVIVLGYDVDDFAKRGTEIWEARVTDNQELRAIIWVNPRTENAHYVCGPWEESHQGQTIAIH